MTIRRSFNMAGISCSTSSDGISHRLSLTVAISLVRYDWLIALSGLCNIHVACINEENYKSSLIIPFSFTFSGSGPAEIDLFSIIT